ncbi:hypothetical protein GOBAR_AA34511 [Gossypium barbadense]|uniref:Uncharacterized protein n=1 Tax=Gossypium barbadense TaxID=3634 RepID=A0A2P5W4Z6_GOSBA|nr:hypothetical protein GOBAR_AA34511 [Gossypium barbadense]
MVLGEVERVLTMPKEPKPQRKIKEFVTVYRVYLVRDIGRKKLRVVKSKQVVAVSTVDDGAIFSIGCGVFAVRLCGFT